MQHANVVKLYAAFEDDANVYMVLAYADCDLFQTVKSAADGKFSERRTAQTVILPLLDALSAISKRGIIHRDIKPENLLMGAGNTIMLADFGLAIDMSKERPVTRTGTLDYMVRKKTFGCSKPPHFQLPLKGGWLPATL